MFCIVSSDDPAHLVVQQAQSRRRETTEQQDNAGEQQAETPALPLTDLGLGVAVIATRTGSVRRVQGPGSDSNAQGRRLRDDVGAPGG